jgi:hypothetical protein
LFNKSELPVDQVKAMRARGFDNNQIVQALQRNGYSSTQIFDALNQAELVSGAMMAQDNASFIGAQPPMPPSPSQGSVPDYGGEAVGGIDVNTEEVEQLVESVIEEKWDELAKDINKVIEWRNDVETRMIKFEQKLESLREEYDKLHQALIGKVGEYDRHILEVSAEIKAMEKVFAKVLPVFTENVNELSRITQSMRK